METSAPLVIGVVNNDSTTLHQIIYFLLFCLVDLSLEYATNFVISWINVKVVWRPQI